MKIKIATSQFSVGADIRKNQDNIMAQINEAKASGARLIHFWVKCVRAVAASWQYAFFFVTMAGVYLLVRRDVDQLLVTVSRDGGTGTIEQRFRFVYPGLAATANEGTNTQIRTFGGHAFCGQGGAEVLGRYGFGDAASRIAEQSLELLTAPNCPSGVMDLLLAPDQMVLQTRNSGLSLRVIAHRYFTDVDIVIGEGFKTARQIPKIEVSCNIHQKLRDEVHGVIAVATNIEGFVGNYVFRLDEAKEIASFIVKRYLTRKGRGETTALLVNGIKVPLKDFIQEALAGTVYGFVKTLKFNDNIKEIELRIAIDE